MNDKPKKPGESPEESDIQFEQLEPDDPKKVQKRIEEIRSRTPSDVDLLRYRVELGPNPTPQQRYDMEYQRGIYESYKPGIDDDGIENFLDGGLGRFGGVVEIGGGPGYICEKFIGKNPRGIAICADIARSPRLKGAGVLFAECDITQRKSFDQIFPRMVSGNSLIVLSYCLDRVSDQQAAIQNFANLVRRKSGGNVGLITVYLPAKSVSPGVGTLDYSSGGKWLTKGESAIEDYELIRKECEARGLFVFKDGFTKHYGVCLDGYEELPCYCIALKPDLLR